jgi:hypothetical protein
LDGFEPFRKFPDKKRDSKKTAKPNPGSRDHLSAMMVA